MNNFIDYLKEIEDALKIGNATEHTHRPALKKLIESLASGIVATNEPKRVERGAPDFIISQQQRTLGHLEAKDVGISLNQTEKTDQLKRYFNRFPNLILTDYLEFRWYLKGENRLTAKIAKLDKNNQLKPDKEGIEATHQLLTQFLETAAPSVNTPRELARRMASLGQLIREAIKGAIASPEPSGMLNDQLESFRKVLIKDLNKNQFADMYAQTICYGLFAARCNCENPANFSRWIAARDLPKTNPFLRSIFGQIAGPDLDDRIAWAVDDLAELLKHTEIESILKDFGKRTRQEDPVVHFYETFLAEYDPKMRESRGVYYTPEPVVHYLVKSVDYLLKNKFKIAKGLADSSKIEIPNLNGEGTRESHRVLILDPAAGTGTFMYGVIQQIYESFQRQKGMWSGYVSQHLLPRLFGFELLMAPYTVAHMKLGLLLQDLGYDFNADERLRVYLTNTLQEAFQIPAADGFLNRIIDEAEAAKEVKQTAPVMVVLGNPPYAYESLNTDPWIVNLVKDYYQIDGKPLGEKNPKGLLDDYVKFIRFAQHRVEATGYGIVALITNHGYLDNPTFRGMRYHLMQTFDEIYLLDLHGNSKKKETCPDGSADKNVFDIQQGVAIGIFVKLPGGNNKNKKLATVYHQDLWGERELFGETAKGKELVGGKYYWLAENDVSSTEWETLKPSSPFYLFKPQNTDLLAEYQKGWKVTEAMPVNSVGIVTARDKLTIGFTKDEIWKTVTNFVALSVEEAREKYDLGKDTRDWKVELAQKDLKKSEISQSKIASILYRPFDVRYTYYTGNSRGFHCTPRGEVMENMLRGDNVGLIANRQVKLEKVTHFSVGRSLVDRHVLETGNASGYFFPLYLYPKDNPTLFDRPSTNAPGGRSPNLAPEFTADISTRLGMEFIADGKGDGKTTFGPEDIFNYMYAVFHSPTYRQRYAEFLKTDFPRLPLTSSGKLFWELAAKGDRLVNLHLMKATAPEITSYPETGDNKIEKIRYTAPKGNSGGKVWINKNQYFEGVSPQVWNFYIGGYQVCQKWLKDRKGRELDYEEINCYQNLVAALAETIVLMGEIDGIIDWKVIG